MQTPQKILFDKESDFVAIPAAKGEMGILDGHSPFIVGLKNGKIRITPKDGLTVSYDISGGVAEILPDKVILEVL